MIRKSVISCLIAICLLTSACTSPDKALLTYASALHEFQDNVILAEQQGFVSEDGARKVLDICDRANVAGQQARMIIDATDGLDPASKTRVLDIMAAVSSSLDPTKIDEILAIKDPSVKQKVFGSLVLARSAISSLMVVISKSKG